MGVAKEVLCRFRSRSPTSEETTSYQRAYSRICKVDEGMQTRMILLCRWCQCHVDHSTKWLPRTQSNPPTSPQMPELETNGGYSGGALEHINTVLLVSTVTSFSPALVLTHPLRVTCARCQTHVLYTYRISFITSLRVWALLSCVAIVK